VQRPADVGNHVLWEVIQVKPGQVIAFVRLLVPDLARPGRDSNEEIDTFIVGKPMHDADDLQIRGREGYPDLLPGLTRGGGNDSLASIQVTGDNAVIAVLVAGIVAAQQEHTVVTNEEEMHGGYELEPPRGGVTISGARWPCDRD